MTGNRHARAATAVATLVLFALLAAACSGDSSSGEVTPVETPLSVDGEDGPSANEGVVTTDMPADADAPVDAEAPDGADGPVVSEGQVVVDEAEVDEAEVDEEASPVAGGTLRFAIEADVDGLNPTTSALSSPGLTMANSVFDTLTAWGADGNPVPYLAESIQPVDGDLTRWRVVVRDGIVFHDGAPLTADAVRVNFEAQLASPLVGLAQRPFFPTDGATTVVDERTIEFTMLEPNAVFPAWLTSQLGMVASPDWLAVAADDPTLNQEPVGTGPFVFDSRSQDSITRVVRNDDWWGGAVHLEAVEFLPVPDPSVRAELLFGGEAEGLHVTDPATVGDLRDDEALQNVIDETGDELFVQLNAAAPPFDDVRARQALALATPLQTFRDLIGLGIARGADQMFIPESVFYNSDVAQQGDDPEAAAALAGEYCADVPDACSDGRIDMELQYPGQAVAATRQAEILAEGWGDVFNVGFNELVQDQHIREVAFGEYEAALWRAFGSLEPAGSRHVLMCRTVGEGLSLNMPRFCSEARDALILDAQAQTDEAVRIADWQGVVQDMNDAFTYVFLLHTTWDNVFDESVRGVCDRTSPDGIPLRCVANGVSWFDSVWLGE